MDGEAAKAQIRAQVAAVLEDRKVGDVCYFLGHLLELEFLEAGRAPLTLDLGPVRPGGSLAAVQAALNAAHHH